MPNYLSFGWISHYLHHWLYLSDFRARSLTRSSSWIFSVKGRCYVNETLSLSFRSPQQLSFQSIQQICSNTQSRHHLSVDVIPVLIFFQILPTNLQVISLVVTALCFWLNLLVPDSVSIQCFILMCSYSQLLLS